MKDELHRGYTRSKHMVRETQIREICSKQFALIFADVFAAIVGVVVFLTLWRADPLYKDIKTKYHRYKTKRAEIFDAAHQEIERVELIRKEWSHI